MENCTLAVRAIQALGACGGIGPEQIRKGVADCFWAGRMEEVLPEVYVDGAAAHTGHADPAEQAAGRQLLYHAPVIFIPRHTERDFGIFRVGK